MDFPPDADDSAVTRFMVVAEIRVMLLLIGRRHQHLDVLTDDFVESIAEQTQAGGIAGLYPAGTVNDDYTIGSSLNQRLQLEVIRW